MTRLSEWLSGFDHTLDVTPCKVEIKGTSYDACSYLARFTAPEGSAAAQRGDAPTYRSFIYCLGYLPACYRRSSRVAFTMAGDPAEWYVACYFPGVHKGMQEPVSPSEYMPFGANFIMVAWDAPGTIDQYEDKPYKRVAIKVTKSS